MLRLHFLFFRDGNFKDVIARKHGDVELKLTKEEKLMKEKLMKSRPSWRTLFTLGIIALCYSVFAFAETAPAGSIGETATAITSSFQSIGQLMMGIAYIAGFGFTIAAIFKFKQHKDNPTQIPIGTPIALLIIGVALIFLPGIIKVGGSTAGLTTAGGFTGEGALEINKQGAGPLK